MDLAPRRAYFGLRTLLLSHLLRQRHLLRRQKLAALHELGERRGPFSLLLPRNRRAEGGQILGREQIAIRHLLCHRRHRTMVSRDGGERQAEPSLVG